MGNRYFKSGFAAFLMGMNILTVLLFVLMDVSHTVAALLLISSTVNWLIMAVNYSTITKALGKAEEMNRRLFHKLAETNGK